MKVDDYFLSLTQKKKNAWAVRVIKGSSGSTRVLDVNI